jgi:hypothetical protein
MRQQAAQAMPTLQQMAQNPGQTLQGYANWQQQNGQVPQNWQNPQNSQNSQNPDNSQNPNNPQNGGNQMAGPQELIQEARDGIKAILDGQKIINDNLKAIYTKLEGLENNPPTAKVIAEIEDKAKAAPRGKGNTA